MALSTNGQHDIAEVLGKKKTECLDLKDLFLVGQRAAYTSEDRPLAIKKRKKSRKEPTMQLIRGRKRLRTLKFNAVIRKDLTKDLEAATWTPRIPFNFQNVVNPTPKCILPRRKAVPHLRSRFEWTFLFGESEIDAFRRRRINPPQESEINEGSRNGFQAMEQEDQAYPYELVSVTYDELRQMAKDMGKGDRERDVEVIVQFIQFILHLWHEQLQSRPAEERQGIRAKQARATYTQTQDYLIPLLKKLKTLTLPVDITDNLIEIIGHLLNANYSRARGVYSQMAIGNGPCNFVMNDVTKGKYIQGLRRLMAKCQEYYPTDPSRCAEYAPERDKLL
ncbi:pre-mRNA-splicing factor 18-like [Zophobas morio]|uniref:pre-mRNA-splicing factor 18-like n=1 Tax=Zophobas morio TaxID=2755281 RepID=UPI003082FD0F